MTTITCTWLHEDSALVINIFAAAADRSEHFLPCHGQVSVGFIRFRPSFAFAKPAAHAIYIVCT